MAKAQFQRHQRVWVECVGTWATIDKVTPVWAKGFDEPVRITYDVGLGREFLAQELQAEPPVERPGTDATDGDHWGGHGTPNDRDLARLEQQARLISAAPQMARLAQRLASAVAQAPEAAPPAVQELAREARRLLAYIGGMKPPGVTPNAARTTDPVTRAAPATDGTVGASRQNL
jgi:hypothetical protein